MDKSAANEYKIHCLLADRWSSVCFSKKSIPLDILMSLMEAARWSPSSRNLQPWRFLTISKKNYKTYKKVLDCLSLNNQEWANAAPLFIVSAVGFLISSIGSFWAMFGSLFFLLACLVFIIPFFRKEEKN